LVQTLPSLSKEDLYLFIKVGPDGPSTLMTNNIILLAKKVLITFVNNIKSLEIYSQDLSNELEDNGHSFDYWIYLLQQTDFLFLFIKRL